MRREFPEYRFQIGLLVESSKWISRKHRQQQEQRLFFDFMNSAWRCVRRLAQKEDFLGFYGLVWVLIGEDGSASDADC